MLLHRRSSALSASSAVQGLAERLRLASRNAELARRAVLAGRAHAVRATLGRVNGEKDVERAPLARAALHPDAAAVRVDDELAEREAEAGAADARDRRVLHALELPEDDVVVLGRDPRAV